MSMVGVPNSLHKHLNNAGFSIHSVPMITTTLDWKSATLFIIPGKCSAESVKFLCIAHDHIFLVSCMRWCFVLAIRLIQAIAVVLSSLSLMLVSCLSLHRACSRNKAACSSLTLMCGSSSSCDQCPLVVLPDSTIWPPLASVWCIWFNPDLRPWSNKMPYCILYIVPPPSNHV